MIEPTNPKLKFFHLLVALTSYLDFYMIGFLLGNYEFMKYEGHFANGEIYNWMHHRQIYMVITLI